MVPGMSAVSLIPELDDVIQRGSLGRRAETLRRITGLFIDGANRFNPDHIDLFEQVFLRLSVEVNAAARTELAHRLSAIPGSPGGVLRRLARDDDITTARPVLTHAQGLDENDLAEIAEIKLSHIYSPWQSAGTSLHR